MSRRATSERVIKILAGARCVAKGTAGRPASMASGVKLSAGTTPDVQADLGTVSSEISKALST